MASDLDNRALPSTTVRAISGPMGNTAAASTGWAAAAPGSGGGMRVAYLVNQYPMVSHSFVRREIRALERLGFDVLRISIRGWGEEVVDPEDHAERIRTRYVLKGGLLPLLAAVARQGLRSPLRLAQAVSLAIKMGWRAYKPLPFHLVYCAEACWIVPLLQTYGACHIHAHFGTNSAEVAMLVNVLCGIPYSFTVHGIAELDRPDAIGLGEKIRRAAFVVAVSSFCRAQLWRWTAPACWEKIKVVHCGLEPAFHQVPLIPVPSDPRLVCVARLSGEKGQLLLVRAAAVLHREGLDFELVLAGDGELRGPIEAEIERHGLGRKVRITGWLSSDQVRNEILAARALVLPSFAEGLPVVLMEAMALRRPVLTTYIAGIPELVKDGENGWLVPAASEAPLVEAMRACLSLPPSRLEEMGRSARERVLRRHDVDMEAGQLARYFRESTAQVHELTTQ